MKTASFIGRNKRLFRSIFLTHIITPLLTLILFSAVSFYAQNIQMSQTLEAQRDCLRSMQKEIDLQMNMLRRTAYSLSNDGTIISAARMDASDVRTQLYLNDSPVSSVSVQNDLLGNLGSIGLYFEKTSSILTTRRYNLDLLDSYSRIYQGITAEDLVHLFQKQQGYSLQETAEGSLTLFYLTPIVDAQALIYIGRVFVNVSLSNIIQNLTDTSFLQDSLFYMAHPKDGITLLFSYDGSYYEPESLLVLSDSGYFSYSGTRYRSLSADTGTEGWNYAILIPERVLTKTSTAITLVILLGFLLSVIIALLLSLNLTNRFYSPTETLLASLQISEPGNSYQSAMGSVKHVINVYQSRLNENRHESIQLKRQHFNNLMLGFCRGTVSYDILAKDSVYADVRLDQKGSVRLLLFHRSREKSNSQSEFSSDLELLQFAFTNVIQEVFPESVIIPIDYDHILAICPDEDPELIQSHCRKVQEFFQKELDIDLDIMLSSVQKSFRNVQEAYQQLEELLAYKNFWANSVGSVLFYEDISSEDTDSIPSNIVSSDYNKIINNIIIQNYPLARQLFEDYLEGAFSMSVSNFKRERFTLYSLITGIIASCSDIRPDLQELPELHSMMDRLEASDNYPALHTICTDLFEMIIASLKEEKPTQDIPDWLLTGRSYIDNHYSDQTLNISTLASHVNVTPSYFSKYFKSCFSVPALDYINLTRVKHAKELLSEGESVQSTAIRVGYNEARTLIRYFRRYEGITPGQYVDITRNERSK